MEEAEKRLPPGRLSSDDLIDGDEEVPVDSTTRTGGIFVILLLAVLGLSAGFSVLIVVLSLLVMLFLHELGHYLVAKKAGMKVTEFFIGFGPKLWSFHRGETEYGIKAIPAGAYVRVIGMNNLDPVPEEDEKRTYRKALLRNRLLLASAGSIMHFLIAIVLLYILLIGSGVKIDESQWNVREVLPNGPAEQIGIQKGDEIIAIGDSRVSTWGDLVSVVSASPGENVTVEIVRNGQALFLSGVIGLNPDSPTERGFLGIARSSFGTIREGPVEAVPESLAQFGVLTKETITGLGDFFSPSGLTNFFSDVIQTSEKPSPASEVSTNAGAQQEGRVVSVVGATRIGAELTSSGWAGLFIFLITINVFIGFFNLIPLLPLDGGHIAVALYEGIRGIRRKRYHADVSKLLPLTYAVVFILVLVGLAAVYLDLRDPIAL
jgi:membrane-associated protease RseP (regulator of RpoE activity)